MRKLLLSTLILVVSMVSLYAQQDGRYTMYMFNGLYNNPAYAGSKGRPSLVGIYRHQWVGIEGAPRTASLNFNTPFRKDQHNIGAGLNFDKLGLRTQYELFVDYAYAIKLDKAQRWKLNLGLRAAADQYLFNGVNANTTEPNDQAFRERVNALLPNIGAGLHLYSDIFYLGFAIPRILEAAQLNTLQFANQRLSLKRRHYFLQLGGTILPYNKKIKLQPSTKMLFVEGGPVEFDFNMNFNIIERIILGASYRLGGDQIGDRQLVGSDVSFIGHFNLYKGLNIGYAYDLVLSSLGRATTGSHEVLLSYDFGKTPRKIVTPRYTNY